MIPAGRQLSDAINSPSHTADQNHIGCSQLYPQFPGHITAVFGAFSCPHNSHMHLIFRRQLPLKKQNCRRIGNVSQSFRIRSIPQPGHLYILFQKLFILSLDWKLLSMSNDFFLYFRFHGYPQRKQGVFLHPIDSFCTARDR